MQQTNYAIELFEKAGFTDTYREDTESFYQNYFDSALKMHEFFLHVFSAEERLGYIPRRMMNRVRYLVSLATNIGDISNDSDALKIVFFQICIEGLYSISKSNSLPQNHFFLNNCGKYDMKYIIDHFKIFDITPCSQYGEIYEDRSVVYDNETSMILFAEILKETRNIVLHEGDFWSIQLFNSREDCGLLSSIQSKKINIKNEIKNIQLQYCDEESKVYFEKHDSLIKLLNSSSELVYFFNTTIDFKKFTAIFVRACVNFITNYINTNLSTTEGR